MLQQPSKTFSLLLPSSIIFITMLLNPFVSPFTTPVPVEEVSPTQFNSSEPVSQLHEHAILNTLNGSAFELKAVEIFAGDAQGELQQFDSSNDSLGLWINFGGGGHQLDSLSKHQAVEHDPRRCVAGHESIAPRDFVK